jgi:hypothetical protein
MRDSAGQLARRTPARVELDAMPLAGSSTTRGHLDVGVADSEWLGHGGVIRQIQAGERERIQRTMASKMMDMSLNSNDTVWICIIGQMARS